MLNRKNSLKLMAGAAILIGMVACGNKKDANQTDMEAQGTETPIQEAQKEQPQEVAPVDTMQIIAALNNLTPEKGIERDTVIHITPSGLKYRVIKEGTGNTPKSSDRVSVNYEGKLTNGMDFDSSYQRGEPTDFVVSGVIEGWTEGLQLMKEGAIYEFYIPANIAYRDREIPGKIPANSDLVFKVELIKIL